MDTNKCHFHPKYEYSSLSQYLVNNYFLYILHTFASMAMNSAINVILSGLKTVLNLTWKTLEACILGPDSSAF